QQRIRLGGGCGLACVSTASGLCPERVVLFAKLAHGQDVGRPERVLLGPVDGCPDLVGGSAVNLDQQPACPMPAFADGRPLVAVAFDPVCEVVAEVFYLVGWVGVGIACDIRRCITLLFSSLHRRCITQASVLHARCIALSMLASMPPSGLRSPA